MLSCRITPFIIARNELKTRVHLVVRCLFLLLPVKRHWNVQAITRDTKLVRQQAPKIILPTPDKAGPRHKRGNHCNDHWSPWRHSRLFYVLHVGRLWWSNSQNKKGRRQWMTTGKEILFPLLDEEYWSSVSVILLKKQNQKTSWIPDQV